MHDKERRGDPPSFPDQLEGVWGAYRDLAATRPAGMGPSPITYLEIEAYQRLTFAGLTAWQVTLIRRTDDALLAIFARDAKAASASDESPKEVPVTDAQAVKSLFKGLSARRDPA